MLLKDGLLVFGQGIHNDFQLESVALCSTLASVLILDSSFTSLYFATRQKTALMGPQSFTNHALTQHGSPEHRITPCKETHGQTMFSDNKHTS